jgi:hypothetical protein
MDRRHLMHVSVLLVGVALLAGGAAHSAALPFLDGFETAAPLSYPSATGWAPLYSGQSAKVVTGVAMSGTQSFSLNGWPMAPRMDYVVLDTIPDHLSCQVSVRLNPSTGYAAQAGFMERYNGTAPMWNFFCVQSGSIHFCGEEGVDLGGYTRGDWVTLRADFDYEDNTGDLYVDGELVAANVPITPREFTYAPLGTIQTDQWGVASDATSFFSNVVYFDEVSISELDPTLPVDIDIKPGSDENPVNLGSKGVLPVCVFSSEEFDATSIDPATCDLAGAGVAVAGGGYMNQVEDMDGDGLLDMLLQFETADLDAGQIVDDTAVLVGSTLDGQAFLGTDQIRLVGRAPVGPLKNRQR